MVEYIFAEHRRQHHGTSEYSSFEVFSIPNPIIFDESLSSKAINFILGGEKSRKKFRKLIMATYRENLKFISVFRLLRALLGLLIFKTIESWKFSLRNFIIRLPVLGGTLSRGRPLS